MAHCFLLRQSDPINSFRKVTFAKQNERNERGPGFKKIKFVTQRSTELRTPTSVQTQFFLLFLSFYPRFSEKINACVNQIQTGYFKRESCCMSPNANSYLSLIQTSFRLLQNHSGLQQFIDKNSSHCWVPR